MAAHSKKNIKTEHPLVFICMPILGLGAALLVLLSPIYFLFKGVFFIEEFIENVTGLSLLRGISFVATVIILVLVQININNIQNTSALFLRAGNEELAHDFTVLSYIVMAFGAYIGLRAWK